MLVSQTWDNGIVAPFAGAWIETSTKVFKDVFLLSLPSRERGLKLLYNLLEDNLLRRSLRGSVD